MSTWKVFSKIKISDPRYAKLKNNSEINSLILQILANRNIKNPKEIEDFLFSKNLYDPFLFSQMEKVVDLIIQHIKAQNKILIYGDYDVDGATSIAVLTETMRTLHAQVDFYVPDRVEEGYGLHQHVIDKLSEQDIKLLITVDLGIRNKKEVAYARAQGLDVIVTDHHRNDVLTDLPDCPIVNAVLPNETYPFKYLAGVGAAYKLACALIQKSKLITESKKILESRILDLVAIGSIADCVPLFGENRKLVRAGLEILNKNKRLGVYELIKIANGTKKEIKKQDTWNIGFQIGPRLNAAGRIESAVCAVKLLLTKSSEEACELAQKLNKQNLERQELTKRIQAETEAQIAKQDANNKIIIAISPKENPWEEGVIGLVAGRLMEKYYQPVLVLTRTTDGYKGSGRSIAEFNIIEALEKCAENLLKYGGHPAACGFALKSENLEKFKKSIQKLAQVSLAQKILAPTIKIDAKLEISDLSEELVTNLDILAPFGQDNPQPVFVSYNISIRDIMVMGAQGEHIKFRFENFWAISFHSQDKYNDFKIGDMVDLVYYLEINTFQNKREVQMKIVDMQMHSK